MGVPLQRCSLCEAVSAEQFGVGWRVSVTPHIGLPQTAEGTDEIPLHSCPSQAIYLYCFLEVFLFPTYEFERFPEQSFEYQKVAAVPSSGQSLEAGTFVFSMSLWQWC